MHDPTMMERIRQGVTRKKGGGFPWLLLAIIGLIVVGMSLRGF